MKLNKEIIDTISESSDFITYPYEEYDPYHEEEYDPYHKDDEIYYDEFFLDENDFLQPMKPTKKPPVVQRTWLDNVLKFRESE